MGKYNGAVVTTAGEGVIAQALQGTKLTWTKMRTSSVAVAAASVKALTALTGIEQETDITDASVYSGNVVQVSARFSSQGVATAYLIQTVGIYGQLAGGSETLIAVMTAVTPDEMPVYDADAPSAFVFTNHLTVQDAASITMEVNDAGTATVADLQRKLDKSGGDLSDTVAATATASSAAYPIPAAGDSFKVILGKIRKFFTDINAAVTGLSISGRTITWTKADGTTGTLTTQDTTYSNATTSAAGLMSAADKTKLNGIAAGAQVNSVTGVKGGAESTYRTGQVNLTPANIGAAAANHNHAASAITSGMLGVARGGTGRNTLTANAIIAGNTTSAVKQIATVSGALYATAENGAAQFGTLPIAQGGTGATTVGAALTNLGLNNSILSQSDRKTVTSGTATTITSVSISEKGLYLIMCRASFDANVNGYRSVLSKIESGTSFAGQAVKAPSGHTTEISGFDFAYFSVAHTLSVTVEQDSGSSLGVTGWIGALRIHG